jgi:SAM-dependent methyltransferase
MAHKEQIEYVNKIKNKLPQYFNSKKVLGIGTFNVCGTESEYFDNCEYTGLDLGPGPGVDIVCPAQDYDAPDESFDVIISCECFEHNPYYKETIQNSIRMLKSGGMFLFTCATTGRPIHGTASLEKISKQKFQNWKTMPNVVKEEWDNEYYKNLTEDDIRECTPIDEIFSDYKFEIETNHCDLYFYGIKK